MTTSSPESAWVLYFLAGLALLVAHASGHYTGEPRPLQATVAGS
jgi:hypothetical protein